MSNEYAAKLGIPRELSDVDQEWILELIRHADGVDVVSKVVQVKIQKDPLSAREGVLSDFCKVKFVFNFPAI